MRTRTNPFHLVAALYLTVGVLAVVGRLGVDVGLVDSLPRLRWVTIHLVTIGGVTQALFGSLPALVRSRSRESEDGVGVGSERESSRWLQWLLLNAGYPLILVGMTAGSTVTAVVGATMVLGALAALVWTVTRASQQGDRIALYYRIAPWFLGVGILAAFGMLLGLHGPGGYFGSLEAHVHANVWGFLALVVAGTLLSLGPRLWGAELRYPRLRTVSLVGLSVGAGGLVAGPWLAQHALTFGGLALYVVGTVGLLANVVGTFRAGERGDRRRLALILGAYLWLVFPVPWAPFVLLLPDLLPGAAIELAAINGLVFGWMLQLAMAFLPLATVAERTDGADFVAAAAAAVDDVARPGWVQIGSVNAGMVALWLTAVPGLDPVDATLSFVGYALVALAWALFVVGLWRAITDRSVAAVRPSLAD